MIGGFTGRVVTAADPGYDDLRRVRNARVDRRPAAIAQCADTGDVAAAIRWARARDLPVAVRGGGGNVAGWGTCDGGIVVDLARLKTLEVSAGTRVAVAGGGLTWGELDAATTRCGLALPGPRNGEVGIGGHTLGGGVGDLSRLHGLTSDNVVSMEVVTASGEHVLASDEHNRDLFWALRGGAGNFGVVTAFAYRLHPVAAVVAGPAVFGADRSATVLRRMRDWLVEAPDAASVVALIWTAPPLDFVPKDLHYERCVVLVPSWFGPPDQADAVLAPLREGAVSDRVVATSYLAHQRTLPSPPNVRRQHVYNRGEMLDELADSTIDALIDRWHAAGPNFSVVLGALGGQIRRAPAGPTAFGHRDATWFVEVCAQWYGAPDSAAHLAPARAAWRSLQPVSRGPYVNLLPDPEPEWARRAYGRAVFDRLAAVKRAWDPANTFRFSIDLGGDLGVGATAPPGGHG